MNIDFSQMPKNTYGIIQTEAETGIVLNIKRERSFDGKNCILSADSLEEAKQISTRIVNKNPSIECSIRDHKGKHLEFIGNLQSTTDVNPLGEKKWWEKLLKK